VGWLRRLLDGPPGNRELKRRLDELAEHVEWLETDLKRLRGRVTGGLRQSREDAPGPAIDLDGDIPVPPGAGVSPQTWARLSAEDRQKLLNRRGGRALNAVPGR
jgi:hypothetical protein